MSNVTRYHFQHKYLVLSKLTRHERIAIMFRNNHIILLSFLLDGLILFNSLINNTRKMSKFIYLYIYINLFVLFNICFYKRDLMYTLLR